MTDQGKRNVSYNDYLNVLKGRVCTDVDVALGAHVPLNDDLAHDRTRVYMLGWPSVHDWEGECAA